MQELNPVEWAVRPLKNYAVFSGRAPRAEYWWFSLGILIAQIPLTIIDKALADWGPLSTAFSLGTLVPSIAVTVRRLHDTNRSGRWVLAFAAVFGVIGVLAALGGSTGRADSTAASFTGLVVGTIAVLLASVTMLVFMVQPGTEGPNDYGPDPYGPNALEEVFA